MTNNVKIKREDLISEDALNWPTKYAKNCKKAIKLNKKLQKSILKTQELQKQNKPTFAEKEADIFRKRLNLLAIIIDNVLKSDKKTKIFN